MANSTNHNNKGNGKTGRPSDYEESMNDRAYRLTLLGLTDAQLGDAFGVHEDTIVAWKTKHPDFLSAIKKGKEDADGKVTEGLFKRAIGYEHPEDHISHIKFKDKDGIESVRTIVTPTTKHYPPETLACIYWLGNRQRKSGLWRNVQSHEHSGKDGGPIPLAGVLASLDLTGIPDRVLDMLEEAGLKLRERAADRTPAGKE
jgi:hypothetical protein